MRTQGYIFYIDKVLLPVAPSSVNISHKNMTSIINLINDAEFNMLKQVLNLCFLLNVTHLPDT